MKRILTAIAVLVLGACTVATTQHERGITVATPHTATMGSQLQAWSHQGVKLPHVSTAPRAVSVIRGNDISQWNNSTNLAIYPYAFLLIREQYGTAGLDTQFLSNRNQVRGTSIVHGFYHYAYPEYNTAQSEATVFATASDWQPGELAVLDMEEPGNWVAWSVTFMQTFESLRGFKPLLYVNEYELYAHDWSPVASNGNGLWAAQWDNSFTSPASGAFAFAAAKQYTDNSTAPGISGRIDADVFYGDPVAFQKYGQSGAPTPQPQPTPQPTPPPPPPSTPPPAPSCSYVVQSGDTLSGIVGADWPSVAAANGLSDPNLIYPGQVLNICGTAPPTPPGCVIVQSGDTLSGLFGSDWPAVARRNGIRNPNLIYPGQRIC